MAFKGVFVGINKYVDPGIPELSGARRDAMALWALFTDTIEQLIPSEVLIEGQEPCQRNRVRELHRWRAEV